MKDDSYFKVDDIDFYKVNNNYSKDITNIVNSVEIEISGIRIDKHYFEWFDIYNEFYESNQSYLNTLSTGYTNNLIKILIIVYQQIIFHYDFGLIII